MRHASDALLTGIGTILADNPLLTDRSGLPRRRRLLRVILDTKLRLSPKARIVKSADQDLLVFTAASPRSPKARELSKAGVELLHAKSSGEKIDLNAALKELGKRDILSVLWESGPRLNMAALTSEIVQKLVLFYAPKIAGEATVPFVQGSNPRIPQLDIRLVQQFGPDITIEATLRSVSKR
jgi:diaminohydroxyphosphoribosylaminopyrimidine deaminase/5-amino-6-(5-phosphoribosylamino)uracil reductase